MLKPRIGFTYNRGTVEMVLLRKNREGKQAYVIRAGRKGNFITKILSICDVNQGSQARYIVYRHN